MMLILFMYVPTLGREGEYIYRLVDSMIGVEGKNKKRVWIDSQTEEEILRGRRLFNWYKFFKTSYSFLWKKSC